MRVIMNVVIYITWHRT